MLLVYRTTRGKTSELFRKHGYKNWFNKHRYRLSSWVEIDTQRSGHYIYGISDDKMC